MPQAGWISRLLCITVCGILFHPYSVTGVERYVGKISWVADGDSLFVQDGDRKHEVRLYGVDAPELGQSHGQDARQYLQTYLHHSVECELVERKDAYGREVCILREGTRCINEELLKAGMAWVMRRGCDRELCRKWLEFQEAARSGKRGLWVETDPTPPWKFRHGGQREAGGASCNPGGGSRPFVGNVASRTFHRSKCPHARCSQCTHFFDVRESALREGYRACGVCEP